MVLTMALHNRRTMRLVEADSPPRGELDEEVRHRHHHHSHLLRPSLPQILTALTLTNGYAVA
jgi:hypothetical protein